MSANELAVLFAPGGVHELRVPKAGRWRVLSGYFDSADVLAQAAASLDAEVRYPGIYFTLNPVKPALLARCANEYRPYAQVTTSDHDIDRRRWLFVDLDPDRPAEIPSTDAEHAAARAMADDIVEHLSGQGWPAPVVMDSGNGAYLFYPIDLPNDEPSRDLIKGCLDALAERFDNDLVHVDTGTFNAARIVRVPGTWNRKGSGSADRPHRMARTVSAPDVGTEVTVEQLAALAGADRAVRDEGRARPTPAAGTQVPGDDYLERFIAEHLPDARGPKRKADGGKLWEIVCPFNPDHSSGEAFVGQRADGKLYAGCHHKTTCPRWRWADLKAKFLPRDDGQGSTSKAETGRRLVVTRASEIKPRAARWLWAVGGNKLMQFAGATAHWLPLGAFALLGGRESSGKTTLSFWIAAQLTKGELPGYFAGKPRSVIVAATEDDWEHTIVPRLLAAGADMDRVLRVEAVQDEVTGGLTLPTDVVALRELCEAEDVALVILDPVMSAVEGALDPHKDRDVRQALEPLSRFAHEAGVTVLGLIHLNKSTGVDLLSRVMGSRAFVAVARLVMMTVREVPEPGVKVEADRYLVGVVKSNLEARPMATKVFEIHGVHVGVDEETGEDIYRGAVKFAGTRSGFVDDIDHEQNNRKPQRETKADRAERWLEDYLRTKGTVSSTEVLAAAKEAGHKRTALYEARGELDVVITPLPGMVKATTWSLPDVSPDSSDYPDSSDSSDSSDLASPGHFSAETPAKHDAPAGSIRTIRQSEKSGLSPRARGQTGQSNVGSTNGQAPPDDVPPFDVPPAKPRRRTVI